VLEDLQLTSSPEDSRPAKTTTQGLRRGRSARNHGEPHLLDYARVVVKRRHIALKFVQASGLKHAQALVDECLAVLDDPAFALAFGPGSQAEAGLLADLPEFGSGARIHGRIDRLAVTDDQVLILDFKTNRPAPRIWRRRGGTCNAQCFERRVTWRS